MLGAYDLSVAWLGIALSLGVVVVCLVRGYFFRYFILNVYLLTCVLFTGGCLYLISSEGYDSAVYSYFYYTVDAGISVLAYFAIASFFGQLFRESAFRAYIRPTLFFFFLLVAVISGLFISRNVENLYSAFAIELEQYLYFVGVLLTFLLWLSMGYLGQQNRRFVLLVSGFGANFAAHAASYALWFLFPVLAPLTAVVPPLAYTFMVGLWLYTFLRVPEEELAVQPAREVFQQLAPVGAHSLRK